MFDMRDFDTIIQEKFSATFETETYRCEVFYAVHSDSIVLSAPTFDIELQFTENSFGTLGVNNVHFSGCISDISNYLLPLVGNLGQAVIDEVNEVRQWFVCRSVMKDVVITRSQRYAGHLTIEQYQTYHADNIGQVYALLAANTAV